MTLRAPLRLRRGVVWAAAGAPAAPSYRRGLACIACALVSEDAQGQHSGCCRPLSELATLPFFSDSATCGAGESDLLQSFFFFFFFPPGITTSPLHAA